jgi:K+-transporting ATPase ATPase A chain
MSPVLADVLTVSALIGALALVHRPLGDYMAAVFQSGKHLRVEKWIYRSVGANPDAEMRWPAYLRGVQHGRLLRVQHELAVVLG